MIMVKETAKTLDEGIKNLMAGAKQDYFRWSTRNGQKELTGYSKEQVDECARDGINSQTQLCLDKGIRGFPTWEINGKLILGVLSLKELSKLTGFKN